MYIFSLDKGTKAEIPSKMKNFLFSDKIDIKYRCNVVYEGTCAPVGLIISILAEAPLRFDEHNNPKKNSEPANHKIQNNGHRRQRTIMGRILEVFS